VKLASHKLGIWGGGEEDFGKGKNWGGKKRTDLIHTSDREKKKGGPPGCSVSQLEKKEGKIHIHDFHMQKEEKKEKKKKLEVVAKIVLGVWSKEGDYVQLGFSTYN